MKSPTLPSSAALCVLVLFRGCVRPAQAAHCGDDDCGPHGTCAEQKLLAQCECDAEYFSVPTSLGGGRQGAYCVRRPPDPNSLACPPFACGEHGTCVERLVDGGVDSECECDLGYRLGDAGACVDDPHDDSEAACAVALCGENATCMATADALSCRCRQGEVVVLANDKHGELGPSCGGSPVDPAQACGPDNCGPYGRCIVAQGVFCSCEKGAVPETHPGSDGREHPFCIDARRPFNTREPPQDAGSSDVGNGLDRQPPDAGTSPWDASGSAQVSRDGRGAPSSVAGSRRVPRNAGGCACRGAPAPRGVSPGAWWFMALTAARRRRRRERN